MNGYKIGKWVGRSRANEAPFVVHARLLQTTVRLAPRIPYPRGAFRFKTHEEAHEWQWNHMIKALAEEGIPLDPPLRERASDAEIPAWLKRVVRWFESRSKK